MKEKGLAPIVIVVLIAAALGVSGYLIYSKQTKPTSPPQQAAKPTPAVSAKPEFSSSTETANWNTYTSQAHKFSIKYPSTLKASLSAGDDGADLLDQNADQKRETPSDIKIRISVSQMSRNFDQIYDAPENSDIPEEQHAQNAKFTKLNNASLEGYKAFKYTYDVPWDGNHTTGIRINKNGVIVEILTYDKNTTLFDQILSTFKFLP